MNSVSELTELIKAAFSERTPNFNGEKYLTNSDLCKFLHISQRTLLEYRETRKIGYYKISGKILYKESDIIKMLEENYIPSFLR